MGDFDFKKDPNNQEELGKVAKQWSFGIKPIIKPKNLDVPGVGNVEVDQAPMWMKNAQYWIGTDVRKDLAKPNAHLYPGPDHYNTELPMGGPDISFTREIKKTTIEKTFAPGPGSYATYGTVGRVRGYLRDERNPRITAAQQRNDE